MNTFLPFPDFEESAAVLDRARLQKQIVENIQIMSILSQLRQGAGTVGWMRHPAVLMWCGWEDLLLEYQLEIIREYSDVRGYDAFGWTQTMDSFKAAEFDAPSEREPWWLYDQRLIDGYQSNLVRKDPEHYRKFFPDIADDLPYFWPIVSRNKVLIYAERTPA